MNDNEIPVAKGNCTKCGNFLIWRAEDLTVWMQERPKPPIVETACPLCHKVMETEVTYKDATRFAARGVTIKHTYDGETDLQPLLEDDVQELMEELDSEISKLLEGRNEQA